jgi:hypothetical protein
MSRLRQLSNAELIAEFVRVYEQWQTWGDVTGIKFRVDTLNAEISRREHCGELGEDDWMLPRH